MFYISYKQIFEIAQPLIGNTDTNRINTFTANQIYYYSTYTYKCLILIIEVKKDCIAFKIVYAPKGMTDYNLIRTAYDYSEWTNLVIFVCNDNQFNCTK